jgi:predicted nucleic acid-binding protein
MNAVDTNVFVYSLDSGKPGKHAKAKAILVVSRISKRLAERNV